MVGIDLTQKEYFLYDEIASAFYRGGLTEYPDIGSFLMFAARQVAGEYLAMKDKDARQQEAGRPGSEMAADQVVSGRSRPAP